jgi:hypothetical protein
MAKTVWFQCLKSSLGRISGDRHKETTHLKLSFGSERQQLKFYQRRCRIFQIQGSAVTSYGKVSVSADTDLSPFFHSRKITMVC